MDHSAPDYPIISDDARPISRGNHVDRHVGLRLRQRRLMMGLTQKQMAKQLGVTYQQIHKYETGINRISVGRLYGISQSLAIPVAWFFDGMANSTTDEYVLPTQRIMLEFMRNVFTIDHDDHLEALGSIARLLSLSDNTA